MRSRWRLGLISAAVLLFWAFAKVRLFQGCEYHHDLFDVLEISSGWLGKLPFALGNRTGLSLAVHSYYAVTLMGPVIRWGGGAYGYFALLLAATAWATTRILRGPKTAAIPALVLLLGPIAFWIFDDPYYGGHFELIYLPLGVLLSLSLVENRKIDSWFWALLLIFMKEDGALLVAGLLLVQPDEWSKTLSKKQRYSLLGACGLAFVLSMAAIQITSATTSLHHTQGKARFLFAIGRSFDFVSDPERIRLFLGMSAGVIALLTGGIAMAWAVLPRDQILPTLRRFAIASIPSLGSMIVSAAFYPDWYHGLTWTTRFVMLWTLWTSALLLQRREPLRVKPLAALCALSVALQIGALFITRDYNLMSRVASAVTGSQLACSVLSAQERGFLSCLGEKLDHDTPVAPDVALFAPFHRQELVWLHEIQNSTHMPELILCDGALRFTSSRECLDDASALTHGAQAMQYGNLKIWSSTAVLPLLRACAGAIQRE